MSESRAGRALGGRRRRAAVLMALAASLSTVATFSTVSAASTKSSSAPMTWKQVVAAANKEGNVVVFTNITPQQVAPINAAFNELYPRIKVTMVNDSVATLPTRFSEARSSSGKSPADVLESSLFALVINQHPNWFWNLRAWGSRFIPDLKQYPPVAIPTTRTRAITSAAYTWRLVYNKNLVSAGDLPKNWGGAAYSQWAGKEAIADPRAAATYMAFYRLLYQTYGSQFLRGLASNKAELFPAAAEVAEEVASGAYAIGFPVNTATVANLIKAGAPIATIPLLPAELGAIYTAFPTKSPDPYAARVYGDFILGIKGQELGCEILTLASLNQKAKGACRNNPVPSNIKAMDLTTPANQAAAILADLGLS